MRAIAAVISIITTLYTSNYIHVYIYKRTKASLFIILKPLQSYFAA